MPVHLCGGVGDEALGEAACCFWCRGSRRRLALRCSNAQASAGGSSSGNDGGGSIGACKPRSASYASPCHQRSRRNMIFALYPEVSHTGLLQGGPRWNSSLHRMQG
mmetsp:Transcript_30048/g.57994  ORF Transcript_30048/g.57994 Transcript_30048/m.57994 type:complete len:106 (+) Transcript_30048:29-346(+)